MCRPPSGPPYCYHHYYNYHLLALLLSCFPLRPPTSPQTTFTPRHVEHISIDLT